jgi:anoctamin-10/anoctamin-7
MSLLLVQGILKDYFGEKIGLYFLFLTHYTTFLFYAGLAGVLVYVHVGIKGDPNVSSVVAFCAFMALWTT